jgi:flagellar hook protein FlgE
MSISRSLEIGVAGLRANSEALSVAGDNIANVNTVGFKKSRGEFQDMVGGEIVGLSTPTPAGAGSRLAHVDQVWTQGAIVNTDTSTDLALSGEGFFIVDGTVAGVTGRFYTRAGQLTINKEGLLVNSDNLRLQGYMAAADGRTLSPAITDIAVNAVTIPASLTSRVDVIANLSSNAPLIADPVTGAVVNFDTANAAGTSNFSNSVTVYDSLGQSHEITIFYQKTSDTNNNSEWTWHATVDGGELESGTRGVMTEVNSGTLTFDNQGRLTSETPGVNVWNFLHADGNQEILFDFGDVLGVDNGTGLAGTTQFASDSTITSLRQDGFSVGSIDSISIASNGIITGVYTNGQQRVMGQIAIADFTSVDGLNRTGQGLWSETVASGQPLIGVAETGGRGSVISGALEQSNVDLASEFVNLILYQRGFQANSRVVTTSDEVYQELVNLKR